jgi:hypothetical protein
MSAANLADLSAVKSQLLATQHFLAIEGMEVLGYHTMPTDDVIDRMVAGYQLVNGYLAQNLDLFSIGHSKALLEINLTVLYGPCESKERTQHWIQTRNIESHFYEVPHGGIESFVEFSQRLSAKNPIHQAAEIYIQTLLQPQLFIEGNHRTGTLLMSYILQRHGYPPFVLSPDNAYTYFHSTDISRYRRNSVWLYFKRNTLVKRMTDLITSSFHQPQTRHVIANR